jgi:endonuclease YncB( thermonuclease family)
MMGPQLGVTPVVENLSFNGAGSSKGGAAPQMKTWAIAVSLIVLWAAPLLAQAPVFGPGRAKDGDSLMVGDKEVRLFGIDAPELDQTCTKDGMGWTCGRAAADKLAQFVTGRNVVCSAAGTDQFERTLGRCLVGSTDVNRAMVASGYAVAFRRYSSDYVSAEESAKVSKRGIWAGTFQMPNEYRHAGDEPIPQRPKTREKAIASSSGWQARASGNCNIKGNRNGKGQWIYHVPGMPYYDQTQPEELFCTEAEARAAGYRRAIVR